MFNKSNKEKEIKAKEAAAMAKEEKGEDMQELGDEELGEFSGAGDPFANRPRVSTKNINSTVRNNG